MSGHRLPAGGIDQDRVRRLDQVAHQHLVKDEIGAQQDMRATFGITIPGPHLWHAVADQFTPQTLCRTHPPQAHGIGADGGPQEGLGGGLGGGGRLIGCGHGADTWQAEKKMRVFIQADRPFAYGQRTA